MPNKFHPSVPSTALWLVLVSVAIVATNYYSRPRLIAESVSGEKVAFRGVGEVLLKEDYGKRAVAERDDINRKPADIVTEPRYPIYPGTEKSSTRNKKSGKKAPADSAAESLRVISQAREAINRIVSSKGEFTDLNRRLKAILDAEMLACSPSKSEPARKTEGASLQQGTVKSEPARAIKLFRQIVPANRAVKAKPRVNNLCERYGKGTQRYTRCIVNEREGQKYIGRQTKKYEMKP